MSGNSMPEGKPYAIQRIVEINPSSALDVGAGRGAYATILKTFLPNLIIDAIEVWEPYIEKFGIEKKYRNIYITDARNHDDYNYDLVIFGDVLEHMPKKDAIQLWEKASKQAKFALISIPIGHFPQGPLEGNPYECHEEEDWSIESVLDTFKGILEYKTFKETGVFIAYFGENNV